MRKIENELVSAIKENRNWGKSNTMICVDRGGRRQIKKNNGNLIAVIDNLTKTIRINSCSWRTNITKTRLNIILQAVGAKGYVAQRNHKWVYARFDGKTEHTEPFRDNMVLSFR